MTGDLRGTTFAYALMNTKPPPCTGCVNKRACGAENLACGRFGRYIGLRDVSGKIPTRAMYDKCFPKYATIEEEDAACRVGRPKGTGTKKNLPERQVCIVCGQEKYRRRDFPRSSTRCFKCRPKRAVQFAESKRRCYARQMAILRGEAVV